MWGPRAGSSSMHSRPRASRVGRGTDMRQLSGVDALHVLEETPDRHMHTIKMVLLAPGPDGVPSYGDVTTWAQRSLVRIPPLRWMVRKVPMGLARPVFIDAGEFDVRPHIRSRRLAAPAGAVELDEVVSEIASVQLDRDRPLWELTYVDGLDPAEFDGAD